MNAHFIILSKQNIFYCMCCFNKRKKKNRVTVKVRGGRWGVSKRMPFSRDQVSLLELPWF